ncbi:MAG: hypothetical protein ACJ8CR_27900 [Roseiflexaceae bacterium]
MHERGEVSGQQRLMKKGAQVVSVVNVRKRPLVITPDHGSAEIVV